MSLFFYLREIYPHKRHRTFYYERNLQMNPQQHHALAYRETDINGAIHRCNESEEQYALYLVMFYDDDTMRQLSDAIAVGAWDDAFTAAHALKGLAGNLGFLPLMHSIAQLVIMIRGGRISDAKVQMAQVGSCYRGIADKIYENFILSQEEQNI